ncbi:DUF2163 domain-containing protein [Aliiroseovarius crassostreae]|uniref:DUF2163 domain-containing protein n=1 Tax=Aliiroseovarius crassostreae TaxID=154981 RepID=A0A9Q9HB55_9RHOB|nr:DUF2163 domain-containing protein [Aliiroseovarius crassostreae]UWP90072.1 DUF2163 domain-containing protein [Aliiroseovarius crassostreae]UWP96373.1 DUF2163 domain-containing protein [Aliiroseovarius crassostreae]UWP99535.1 DUF2163 domain-containing protein [Aliiroseovarius crassostreae]UWQ02722.1 DUF2163 domain-containing protein [Aliiroseovarius crassostreae]
MPLSPQFEAHFATGMTTVCRAWVVTRRDGEAFGFTDHDRDLMIGAVLCKADTGLTAYALEQTTGLSIDNSEAMGALTDAAITEEDIRAGRYDGAEVEAWLVNWETPSQRYLQFRGNIGEITRENGAFRAELVGLSEALNRPQGRAFQKPCSALLGDKSCKVDLDDPAYAVEAPLQVAGNEITFSFAGLGAFDSGWFEKGRLSVKTGDGAGLVGLIRKDKVLPGGAREITLWEALRAEIVAGDVIRLEAGCDKRAETCKAKFDNLLNFRGFPTIPGEDWLMSYPVSTEQNDGGALS